MSKPTGAGPTTTVGLRIDVDTFRGTRLGVPRLLRTLEHHGVSATFFFCVGPDNMGRHLWRLARPRFLFKMLRSRAPSLYGWDIVLRGTLGRGPLIGERLAEVIRDTDRAGHEVGLHAWDHHWWQRRIERATPREIHRNTERGLQTLHRILGRPVTCSAAPGWRCTNDTVRVQSEFGLTYHSDCRGEDIFRPAVADRSPAPQIPVTLPTYDELVGRAGVSDENYNAHLLGLIRAERLNVLTVHAEVEGIAREALFDAFLGTAIEQNVAFVPLGRLLADVGHIPEHAIAPGRVEGRDGWLALQGR